MKEIECGGCKKKYSDEYEYCPYCGTKNGQFKLIKYKDAIKEKKTRKANTGKFLVIAVIIAAIAGLIVATGIIMNNNDGDNSLNIYIINIREMLLTLTSCYKIGILKLNIK